MGPIRREPDMRARVLSVWLLTVMAWGLLACGEDSLEVLDVLHQAVKTRRR